MKKILANLQIALKNIEAFNERRQKLESEQSELGPKIKELTAAVGGADAKSVNALAIAQARLKLMPDELAAAQAEYEGLIGELQSLVSKVVSQLHEIYAAARVSVEKEAEEFLEKHLGSSYLITEITRQILGNSKKLAELEKFKVVFSSSFNPYPTKPSAVISRAEYAIKNLGEI